MEPALGPDGRPCVTAVPLGDRTVLASVWRVRVGRVQLFLLDTDLEENAPGDRELSARLYGGERETRLQQEIVLGIGGVRALKLLGYQPALYHLNEGHAAFVVLQRVRDLCDRGRTSRPRWPKCGAPRRSRRTRRWPPATMRSRSTWWRRTWRAVGRSGRKTARSSWSSATSTTARARSST